MSLYVHETGPAGAPTIVFLHGGGVSSWMWAPQVEQLQQGYHLLVPDLPGHGQSAGEMPFTMEDAAQRMVELIRSRAHGGRAHVVGLSLGAQLVIKLLSVAPEVVDHAIASSALVQRIPGLWLLKPSIQLNMPLLKFDWLIRMQRKRAAIPEQYHAQFRAETQALTADILYQIYSEILQRIPAGLERVTRPVLIVAGEKELGIMHRSTRNLVAAIPGAKGYLAAGLGHTWNLQAPELFTAMVRAWVNDRPLPEGLLPL